MAIVPPAASTRTGRVVAGRGRGHGGMIAHPSTLATDAIRDHRRGRDARAGLGGRRSSRRARSGRVLTRRVGHHRRGSRRRTSLRDARPDVVVNCAAWTDVDGAEQRRGRGARGERRRRRQRRARRRGVRRMDDPRLQRLRVRRDQALAVRRVRSGRAAVVVRPLEAGRRARGGARGARAAHTIVRSSWLFGAGGPCFPATILRLAARARRAEGGRGSGRVPDLHRAPGRRRWCRSLGSGRSGSCTSPAGGAARGTSSRVKSWPRAGVSCEVRPCSTAEMPRPATRPAYSVLRSERGDDVPSLPDWREGLARVHDL